MDAIFEIFLKSCHIYFLDTLGVENFDEIALSLTVKEIEAFLCFALLAKIRKFKMAAIFENFWKVGLVYFLDTLGVENFDEIAVSLTLKEIAYILRFCIFGENMIIQNGRHFWKVGLVYS